MGRKPCHRALFIPAMQLELHPAAYGCRPVCRYAAAPCAADADTLLAQTLKLKVRDAVLESFQACPEQSQDAARRWAAQNLGRIQLQAQSVLAQAGAPGPVQVQLVNMYFDTTRYAAGSLPAGRYDAVRVQLGTGHSGKNWWCVLSPRFVPRRLHHLCRPGRKRPGLRRIYRPLQAGRVVAVPHPKPGGYPPDTRCAAGMIGKPMALHLPPPGRIE